MTRLNKKTFEELKKTGQMKLINNNGVYKFSGLYLDVMNAIDELFVEIAKENYDVVEENYPAFISIEVLNKVNYYYKFPSFTAIIYPIDKENEEVKQNISYDAKANNIDKSYFKNNNKFLSSNGCFALNPSTCYHTFHTREMDYINDDLNVVTAVSNCFRNEENDNENPLRLSSFQMRESVFIGNNEKVKKESSSFFNLIKKEFERLEIKCETNYASDVFFGETSAITQKFQIAHKVKLELTLPIPMLNDSSKEIQLACMSRNLHGNYLCNTFRVKSPYENLESACVAVGLERIAFALLCQIGFNVEDWNDCRIKQKVLEKRRDKKN